MHLKTLLAAALIAGTPFAANAAVFGAAVSGAQGATVTLNVSYTGDGAVAEAQADLDFSNANITISNPTILNGATNCLVVSPTRLRIIAPSGGAQPLPAGPTNYCSFSVAIGAAAPEGLIPFTLSARECFNTMGADVTPTCTLAANSGVTVANTPVPRNLTFNPAPGSTITLAGGTLSAGGTSATSNIAVTSTGNSGTPTVSGCAITGAGAANFSVTPTSLSGFDVTPSQNLGVSCVYSAVATTATLTCTETDGDTPAGAARAFPLSCPAQAVIPVNPTISATPATGSTVTVSAGLVGTQGTSTIDFSATGGAGTGATVISCTSTGNVVIANAPGTPSGTTAMQTVTGSAQPLDLRVGVSLTANAQAPAGMITCTAGAATFTYTVNAPAGSTVVPPTFIPSSSTWSTLALLSLLGVFGLLAVGFRRQS